jgi:hypothetical protein
MLKGLSFGLILLLSVTTLKSQSFRWAGNMGGAGNDQSNCMTMDSAGNVYTVGSYSGEADFDPGPGVANLTASGMADIFITRFDGNGNLIWAKSAGGIDSDAGTSAAVDQAGNVYITGLFWGTADFDPGPGTFNLTSLGSYDLFILKLDASGNFVWAKSIGGADGDYGNALTLDPSGFLYVAGTFEGTVDFDPGPGVYNLIASQGNELFLLKLDATGNFVWAKQTEGSMDINVSSVVVDGSGNICFTGNFQGSVDLDGGPGTLLLTSAGADDVFASKYNSSGDVVWAKSIGGTSFDYGFSMAVDTSGNVYTTGSFKETVDFDPGAGTNVLTSFNASEDIFILKLDASGDFLWAAQMGGISTDRPSSIAINTSGIYSTGFFSETSDFDPGTGTVTLTSNGSLDIYVLKLDFSGTFAWVQQMGGSQADIGYAIAAETGAVLSTGNFREMVDFDPTPGIFDLTSAGLDDVFVQKLSDDPVTVINEKKSDNISILPNPNNGIFSVVLNNYINESITISIYNATGLKVYELRKPEVTGLVTTIDIGCVEDGLYTVVIHGQHSRIIKKLIVTGKY